MSIPKGLTWNQNHLTILYHLQQGLGIYAAAQKTGLSVSLCQKVDKQKKSPSAPDQVTEEMIASAAPPIAFGAFDASAYGKKKPETAEQATTPIVSKKVPVTQSQMAPVIYTTAFNLANQVGTMPMTVDIQISYILALRNGYEGELGDWLSNCCRDWWTGRGHNMYEEYEEALSSTQEVIHAKPT